MSIELVFKITFSGANAQPEHAEDLGRVGCLGNDVRHNRIPVDW
jgi:hypothetical protein